MRLCGERVPSNVNFSIELIADGLAKYRRALIHLHKEEIGRRGC